MTGERAVFPSPPLPFFLGSPRRLSLKDVVKSALINDLLLNDRTEIERSCFLCIHVSWNWTQMCDVKFIICHLVSEPV